MSEQQTKLEPTQLLQRRLEQFQRDNARVIARYFGPENHGQEGLLRVVRQLLELSPEARAEEWKMTRIRFATRHRNLSHVLRRHLARLVCWLEVNDQLELSSRIQQMKESDQLLLASYVTSEYSVESAAFFNPSIVPHPSQDHLEEGAVRFIMSFRATGEGHISSVAFRAGVVDSSYRIHLNPVSPFISAPIVETHRRYDKLLFARKLQELNSWTAFTGAVVVLLPDQFTRDEMEQIFRNRPEPFEGAERENGMRQMRWLAESNYTISFDDDEDICERVIFPVSSAEAHGIEDARFVRFVDDDGSVTYFATYTAYSGNSIGVQLIETQDFRTFHICTLNGPAVHDKGMALFPRKINGDYYMLGRQDSQSITLSRSRHMHFWYNYTPIIQPRETWELVKIGNCGSPIETSAGWLVLTHGVGAVRRYCIGAALLDLNDPTKVIGRLRKPLIEPLESEREGYVPNVVYTCGAMLHREQLIIPYAMSDTRSGIATVRINDLIQHLLSDGA